MGNDRDEAQQVQGEAVEPVEPDKDHEDGLKAAWMAGVNAAPQPPAPEAPAPREIGQFLTDVLTAAGLVSHGRQCKALGARLGEGVMRLFTAGIHLDADPPAPEAQGDVARDAERYRAWRAAIARDDEAFLNAVMDRIDPCGIRQTAPTPEEIDAAIDAAMEKEAA